MENLPRVVQNPVTQGSAVAPPYSGVDFGTMNQGIYNNPFGSSQSSSGSSGILGGLFGLGTSILNNIWDDYRAKQQQAWNEEMWNKQNEWNLNMWNMTNAYNSPAAQKQRMSEAGLNPLNYGLDGSSASAMQSAQPLGYERSTFGIVNPYKEGLDAALKQAQLANMDAVTNKVKSETSSVELDNQFKQMTLNARAEGVSLANSLTKKEIEFIESQRGEIAERIKYLAEQSKSEVVKRDLMKAEEHLRNMEAQKIVELLPFEKALLKAQTQAQKAQASLAYWQAAIQKGLFNGGIVNYEIESLITQIQRDEAVTLKAQKEADLLRLKQQIKSGHAIDVDSIPKWMLTDRIAATFWNSLLQRANEVTECMGGVIAPVVGYGLGKGAAGKAAGAASAEGHGRYTTLYGADGKPISYNSW